MTFPPTTDTVEQVTRKAMRNTAIGLVAAYAVSFGICIFTTSAAMAAGISLLPALFAAPFIGSLITVVSYSRVPKHH
jgi:hypothetical protein